ncbi:hypothetical protein [Streptomyces sp. ME19-01-6]|uniref:hypothetical protein n=1 Tax=Streptomyces sp. ME19-01-6 TaxID=3028686 RepID=UPI0029ACBA56|nr:hypothetical protein [Streptomyces sp. ME19-01-6]MDX3233226.1 hypothetical protein [Streptomyces sp. ME19-01-6]
MTFDETPEGEGVRPFAVPIKDDFAAAAAEVLRRYRELVEKCFPDDWQPETGSRLVSDIETINANSDPVGTARGSLHGMLLEIAGLSWDTALDHVRALEHDIVRKPPPVWSPLVAARAVLESCLFLEYLIDPSISCALRLARCAGLWRKDTEHTAKLARVLGPEREVEAVDLDAYVTQSLADANVVQRHNAKGKLVGYEVDGESAGLDYNITERVASALPSWLPTPYGLLSGAAHSRPWMTNRARNLAAGSDDRLVGEAATVMTALMVVMASLEMSLVAWQGYFGFDLTEPLAKLADDRNHAYMYLLGLAHATGD